MSTDILDPPPAYSADDAVKIETAVTDAFLVKGVQSALEKDVGQLNRSLQC